MTRVDGDFAEAVTGYYVDLWTKIWGVEGARPTDEQVEMTRRSVSAAVRRALTDGYEVSRKEER